MTDIFARLRDRRSAAEQEAAKLIDADLIRETDDAKVLTAAEREGIANTAVGLVAETNRAQTQERLARWSIPADIRGDTVSMSITSPTIFSVGWSGLPILTGDSAAQPVADRAPADLAVGRALYIDQTQTFDGSWAVSEADLTVVLQQSFVTGTNFLLITNRNGRAHGPLATVGQASLLRADLAAETTRAVAVEGQTLDLAVRSKGLSKMLHRTSHDQLFIGLDAQGGIIGPLDHRGYAKPAIHQMLSREPGDSRGLLLLDRDGNVVVLDSRCLPDDILGLPPVEVVTSANAVDINIRQYGSTYVQWRMRRIVFPARVADVWRVLGVYDVTRIGAGLYTPVQELFNTGEVEMAIAILGKQELIGGTTHGGEMLTNFYCLLDGAEFDHTVAGVRPCNRIEFFQRANMFEPGPSGGVAWPADPAQVGANARHWRFDRDGLTLGNYVVWNTAGFGIVHSYFGLSPMRRFNDPVQITHTAARAPLWEPVDMTNVLAEEAYTPASAVKVWGDRYAVDTSATRGWDRPSRNVWVRSHAAYNKIYYDFHGGDGPATGPTPVGDTTEVNTVWDVETKINVTIKEPVT